MILLYTRNMETKTTNPRWWDPLAAVFLLIALLSSATRLYATGWTTYLERVQYLVLLGTIAGLALGKSRFSPSLTKWIAFGYTLFAIPWQLGSTLSSDLNWSDRLAILLSRVGVAGNDVLRSRPVHDPILFLALMAVLFWLLGITAGYYLTRYGQAWPAIIPAGIALIVISHFDPGLASWAGYLGFFVFFSLLIVGRLTYLRYRAEWDSQGVMAAPGTGADMSKAAAIAVVVLVLFAWTVPALGSSLDPASQMWVKISKPWDNLRSRFTDAFSALQTNIGTVTDFYGSSLALGTGTRLGNDVVFTVRTTSAPPKGSQYYWLARTYDYYNGDWSSTIQGQASFKNKDITITYPQWKSRVEADFTITPQVTLLSTIYSPSLPLSVSRSGSVDRLTLPDGTEDVSVLTADPPLRAGEPYQVRGLISNPTASELRSSGSDYPSWVTDRYLQLPSDLSPDFAALAKRITVGMDNPYDKVDAVTNYLRRTITYSVSIPPPPEHTDALYWFLFDVKKGFCNYYASAEIVMLRTLGIPARLAVGFAQGQGSVSSDPGSNQTPENIYTVRYKDSHAWPEVYFNGVGWVEFEPTVSQPRRTLPAGANDPTEPLNFRDPSTTGSARAGRGVDAGTNNPVTAAVNTFSKNPVASISITVLLLAAIVVLVFFFRKRRLELEILAVPVWAEKTLQKRGISVPAWLHQLSRWALFSPLQRTYGVINSALQLLGRKPRPSETPSERAALLGKLLPIADEPAQAVLVEYQQAQYGRNPGDLTRAQAASQKLRWLAWKEFFSRLFRRFDLRGRV